MTTRLRTRVFLDSSIIIAAMASRKGGAAQVLVLAEAGIIVPIVSDQVVAEVLRNIQKKLPQTLGHLYATFKTIPFTMAPDPSPVLLARAEKLINRQDAPLLAAAVAADASWLLSLDRHFLSLRGRDEPGLRIGSPRDFLGEFPHET